MGTKANPAKYDCYANAEPDEPLFVLLARDKHAPTLVWLWAVLRELDQEDAAVVAEARECVVSMVAWAAEHGRKSVGVAHAVLAGVLEMIRAVNHGTKDAKNAPTTMAEFRRFLCAAEFEKEGGAGEPGPADTAAPPPAT